MSDARLAELARSFSGRTYVDAADMAPFLTDWRGLWRGDALAVVQPDTAEGVAAILRWAHAAGIAVTPQGGNTGLAGGATPAAGGGGIVLSLTRLNRIRAVDPVNDSLTVEAGCTLGQVQAAAAAHDRLFPLSMASEGSCTIGGALATNAGGTGVLRYGNARELCLGLEVATPSGELWDGLRGLRKDNSGYALRDLFIGSEGTLGIITAAVVKLSPRPDGQATAFVGARSPDAAVELLAMARAALGPSLTAFELVSKLSLDLVLAHVPSARCPLAASTPWYVLIEVSDSSARGGARDALETLLAEACETQGITDAAIATSLAQSRAFWGLREHVSEAQGAAGPTIKHDISVRLSDIATFIADADEALLRSHPDVRPVVFGHLGDGNIHYNVSPVAGADREAFLARQDAINRVVHDLAAARGGSISAEHGLGVLRRDEAVRYKAPVELAMMRAIKTAFDPTGIMNPGKLLAS